MSAACSPRWAIPPLFLGYLEGVPFTWTLRLWPQWLFLTGSLLVTYFVWDSIAYTRGAAGRPAA